MYRINKSVSRFHRIRCITLNLPARSKGWNVENNIKKILWDLYLKEAGSETIRQPGQETSTLLIKEMKTMGTLTKIPNIGESLEKQLFNAGITTEEELRRLGNREAWLRILKFDPSACYMRLCALEGAIQGVRWHNLDSEIKASLKEFYNKYKSNKG